MANRLSKEKSPYLRQHMNNPVDWYPWGDEAFEKARIEDKPIFLSIGYSTCHWCHVMAHESFEDEEAAEILNRDFVPVKVDREERPDIDAVYMRVCQAMTGSGGWPLTIIMTDEQKPFFAGTYLPTHNRYGRLGLVELLNEVARRWEKDREALLEAADQIASAVEIEEPDNAEPDRKLLDRAYRGFEHSFDSVWGGFGAAPKFPSGHNLLFLMTRKEPEAMKMAETTLKAMANGGIFDQIGGGFSRYSTDEKWLVPHFEKMLYDNALLIIAYTNAFRITKNEFYTEIARRTADYILKELKSPEGGIFSSQDADSDGVEGKYYIFTPREIKAVLGEKDGEEFCSLYGINGKNGIPNLIGKDRLPWGADDGRTEKLYAYRKNRTNLHTDNKILLSWNAWAVMALTLCGQVLSDRRYLKAAMEIQNFLERKMVGKDGRLYLRYCDGEAAHEGQLEDYGVYALALLGLYRATFDVYYLYRAASVGKQMIKLFEDEKGGYFLTAHDSEKLIHRPKETYDGAMPSGNSVAGMVLETLAQLTSDSFWRDASDRQIRFLSGSAQEYPRGYAFALMAIKKAIEPSRELIVCSKTLPPELYNDLPQDLNILHKSNENAELLTKIAPFTADYPVPDSGAMWYLCENGACKNPVTDFKMLNI